MALVDYQNKVIYWDEVNWKWLPYLRVEKSGNCYLGKRGSRLLVQSKDDAIKVLESMNFRVSPLKELGLTEVSCGCFLYKGRLYQLDNKRPSIIILLGKITGKSSSWLTEQIKGKGTLPKGFIQGLVSETAKIHFRGKVYDNYSQFAEEFGVSKSHISNRLSKGDTLEEIVQKMESTFVTDPLGNKYKTYSKMAEAYGIDYHLFMNRLKNGWSLERALSSEKTSNINNFRNSKECVDHLGNVFPTQTKMVAYYGVRQPTFLKRLSLGWTLEEALTGKRRKNIKSNK